MSHPVVTIACDKFKGSLTSSEAASAIAAGLPEEWEVKKIPIADGGEGFFHIMADVLGGEIRTCQVHDPLGREVEAKYAVCEGADGKVAYMEMAQASGLALVQGADMDVMQSSTFGTGEMLLDAHALGVSKIVIGIGGSATNDGGAGMARALGARLFDRHETELLGHPRDLSELARVDLSDLNSLPPIEVACDVDNPLFGESGAAAVFGPQKGASETEVPLLDGILERFATILKKASLAKEPGAGAAGGLGFGLMAFCGATLRPGFDLIAETLQLREQIQNSDLVITGEGSMDLQTLGGKGPAGVAVLARDAGVPCVGVGGRVTKHIAAAKLFDATISLEETGEPLDVLMAQAAQLLEQEVRKSQSLLKKLVSS